jgi:hypothetical protein
LANNIFLSKNNNSYKNEMMLGKCTSNKRHDTSIRVSGIPHNPSPEHKSRDLLDFFRRHVQRPAGHRPLHTPRLSSWWSRSRSRAHACCAKQRRQQCSQGPLPSLLPLQLKPMAVLFDETLRRAEGGHPTSTQANWKSNCLRRKQKRSVG